MSTSAKEEMLTRIRCALAGALEAPDIPQDFRKRDPKEHAVLVEEFIDRLRDYKATVTLSTEADLPLALVKVCQQHVIERLVVPVDVPDEWIPIGVMVLRDEPHLTLRDLDTSSGVLTGCALGVAQTGTIILDGGTLQGRRVLSLVPDVHLCIVHVEQVVGLVPEAIGKLVGRVTRPLTLVSGPSATSDIELSRVEGVHGPRTLHVLVVQDQEQ